jgi:S1-C subfamily serine protease
MNDILLQGVPVKNVIPGSPAAKAGILIGDLVVFCNGDRVNTHQSYVDARTKRDDITDITVLRGRRCEDTRTNVEMIDFRLVLK